MLCSIKNGFFLYDGGSLFGVAPKMAWQEAYSADADNRCRLVMRSLLVKTADRLIMIDAGVGIKHADVMATFGFSKLKNFDELLAPMGYKCSDITDLVLTHLHFEHCGGCTSLDGQDLCLSFPNAMVHVGEEQWKTMLNPNERERYMMIPADVMEAFKKGKLNVIKETFDLCEGVQLRLVDGHSKAQIVPYITAGDRTYVFAGDVIPTSAHLSLDWLDAHDIDPLTALAGKQSMLEEAVKEGQWIIFPHDAQLPCAKICKKEDFQILEKEMLNE